MKVPKGMEKHYPPYAVLLLLSESTAWSRRQWHYGSIICWFAWGAWALSAACQIDASTTSGWRAMGWLLLFLGLMCLRPRGIRSWNHSLQQNFWQHLEIERPDKKVVKAELLPVPEEVKVFPPFFVQSQDERICQPCDVLWFRNLCSQTEGWTVCSLQMGEEGMYGILSVSHSEWIQNKSAGLSSMQFNVFDIKKLTDDGSTKKVRGLKWCDHEMCRSCPLKNRDEVGTTNIFIKTKPDYPDIIYDMWKRSDDGTIKGVSVKEEQLWQAGSSNLLEIVYYFTILHVQLNT